MLNKYSKKTKVFGTIGIALLLILITAIRIKTKIIIGLIALENDVQCEAVGFGGMKSQQWDRYIYLRNHASDKELIDLTNAKNAAVRCYAFNALVFRKNRSVQEILLKHLYDNEKVRTFCGCINTTETIGDYYYNVAPTEFEDPHNKRIRYVIDSLLLFDNNIILKAKDYFLRYSEPEPLFYNKIRDKALRDSNLFATLALARYRNLNDTGIIKNFLRKNENIYYNAYVIREYPDDSFYPFLVKMYDSCKAFTPLNMDNLRIIVQALAKYPTTKTLKIFESALNDEVLNMFIYIAINKYPNDIFEHLNQQIHVSEFYKQELPWQMKLEP
jgi:hypothetical protein